MTVLYSNDFESYAHVATVSDFTVTAGSALQVLDEGSFSPPFAIDGVKSYGRNGAGDRNYWNGGSAIGAQAIRCSQYYRSGHCAGLLLRIDTAQLDTAYFFYYQDSGGNLRGVIDRRSSGENVIANSSYNIPVSSGDTVHMEARAIGSSLDLRVWVGDGTARPSTATVSGTDSNYTTGRQGIRIASASTGYATLDQLVITDAGGGEDFFYPTSGGSNVPLNVLRPNQGIFLARAHGL